MTRSNRFILAIAVVSLHARPLAASGTILSLTATPNPAAPNQEVTLKMTGAGGPCRALIVFGDGASEPLLISAFPAVSKHRYPAGGFVPRAEGRATFVGSESTGSAPPPCMRGAELKLSVLAAGAPKPAGGTPGTSPSGGSPGGGSPGGGSPGGSAGAPSLAPIGAPSQFSVAPTRTPTPPAVSSAPGGSLASQGSIQSATLDLNSPSFQQLQNPTISKVTDGSQATPGGTIGVEGSGFGTWTVNRRLILKTGGKEVDLQNLKWGDRAAAGTVPDDFGGVPDGAATIHLVNGIKQTTNEVPLSFTAARVTIEIVKRPVLIRGCYKGGMFSRCNGWDTEGTGGVQDLDSAPSVEVLHSCPHWDFFHSGDDGNDLFEVQLKNGWLFEDAKVEKVCGGGDLNYSGNCYLIENLQATVTGKGKSTGSISTSWHVPRMYTGSYVVHMLITGPAGVPYN